MEALWNTMISYLMTSLPTKGFEPGSMEYKFPLLNLHKIHSISLKNESLRNIILHSFDSFNNGYFFIVMQIALCIYCPSLALAIIYQEYDLEQEQEQEQSQPQQPKQLIQNICQSQTDQQQQFVIRQLLQEVQQQQQLLTQQKQIKISTQYNDENGGINAKITIVIKISNAGLDEERQVYVIEAGQVQSIIIF